MTFQAIPGAEMVGTTALTHAKMPVKVYQDGGATPVYGLGDYEWWRDYDVLDVPDFCYPWSVWFAERHDNVWLTVWDNLPWNANPEWVERLHKRVRGYICRHEMIAASVRELVGTDKPIYIVPAGVDTEMFSSDETNRPIDVLFVGRIVPEKGFRDLIQACAWQDWHTTIVGPCNPQVLGTDKSGGQIAMGQCLQPIYLTGSCDHHLLPSIYQDAKLFIYPSKPTEHWVEQFGVSVIEAMACGLPCIVSDSGALPDLLPPESRVTCVVPAGRWDLLRERIRYMVDNPGIAQHLGWVNRERVERLYSSEVVGKQLEAIYGS